MLCVFVCLFVRMANVECHTKKGCTPFHLACKEGHLEISKLLHKHGADMEVNEIVTSLFNCVGVVMLLISFHYLPDYFCQKDFGFFHQMLCPFKPGNFLAKVMRAGVKVYVKKNFGGQWHFKMSSEKRTQLFVPHTLLLSSLFAFKVYCSAQHNYIIIYYDTL